MAQSILSGLNRAMANAIPLIMRMNKMDWERDKYEQKEREDEEELEREAEAAKTKIAVDLYKSSIQESDQPMAQATGGAVEKASGLSLPKTQLAGPIQPGGDDLTRYLVPEKEPEEETFKLDKTLWDLAGGDFKEFAKMKQLLKGKGISLTTDSEGNVQFSMGGAAGEGATMPTKAMTTKLQEKQRANIESLSGLRDIVTSYQPKFTTAKGKGKSIWLGLKDKFQGVMGIEGLDEDDKAYVQEATAFYQDTVTNVNKYIHDMTGAQMSAKEADRLRAGIPDVGDPNSFMFWLQGDGPSEFEGKLKNIYHKSTMAVARYNYYLNKGISPEALNQMVKAKTVMHLDRMDAIIDARGAELERQLKKEFPGIEKEPGKLFKMVKERIRQEFMQ